MADRRARRTTNQTLRFNGGNAAALDQIMCAIRPVDTFNKAESGVGIAELRADMKTVAQGDGNPAGEGRGYNTPSLLGLGAGAPYLHGGNARTLEGMLGSTFDGHHRAVAANFLTQNDPAERARQVDQLVAFLLALDEDTTPVEPVKLGAQGGLLCPAAP